MSDVEAVVRWLVVLSAISVAFAPAIWWLGQDLHDAASSLLKALPVVFLTAIVWWPAAALGLPYSTLTLATTLVVAGALLWSIWLLRGGTIPWRPLVAFEALWLGLFAVYILFRSYQPNIANTEKPMEIALLSSISRSSAVPAPDPWFAGEHINYYYFGYQTVATLVKLSGVPSSIAFNLALATLFASVGTIAAGAGYRIAISLQVSRIATIGVAAASAFFVVLAGNLEAISRLIRDPRGTWESGWWYDGVGWQASRIIVDHGVHGSSDPRQTINEFPAFSFVLGDLHPHVLTYPLLLSLMLLVTGLVLGSRKIDLPGASVLGILVGLLYVSNSWDAPTGYVFLAVGVLASAGWRLRQVWPAIAISTMAAVVVALPFVREFVAPVGTEQADLPGFLTMIPGSSQIASTIGVVTWRPSGSGELAIVHGHWILVFGLFAVLQFMLNDELREYVREKIIPIAAAIMITALLAALWAPAIFLIGIPASAALLIAVRSRVPVSRAIGLLFTAGFGLVLVPEFMYIQDAFGDRMNTVFKLYFQAWLPLAVASAATFALALSNRRTRPGLAGAIAVALVMVITAPYTPISARDWTGGFFTRYGLDGAAYIERSSPGDAAALAWLNNLERSTAVIVESPGCSYGTIAGIPMNRMSAFSGYSTLAGWEGHQRQWRRGEDEPIIPRLENRQTVANRWLDGDITGAPGVPDPDYIILGMQEASGSPTCEPLAGRDTRLASERLEQAGWTVVFTSGETRILARP